MGDMAVGVGMIGQITTSHLALKARYFLRFSTESSPFHFLSISELLPIISSSPEFQATVFSPDMSRCRAFRSPETLSSLLTMAAMVVLYS